MNSIKNEKLYNRFLKKVFILIGLNHISILFLLFTLQFYINHNTISILFITYNLFADLIFIVIIRNTVKKGCSPYNVILIYLILTFPTNLFLFDLLVPSLTHQASDAQGMLTYKVNIISHQHSTINYLFQLQNFDIDFENQKEVESVFKSNYKSINRRMKYGLGMCVFSIMLYIIMLLLPIVFYSIDLLDITILVLLLIIPFAINVVCVWVLRSTLYIETYKVWKEKEYLLYYLLINGTIFNINSGYGFINGNIDNIREKQ